MRYLYKEADIDQKEFIKEHEAVLKNIKRNLASAFNQPISQSLYVKALFFYTGGWSLDFPEVDPNYEKTVNAARIILEKLAKEDYKPARFWLTLILTETNQQQAGFELHYINGDYPLSVIELGKEYVKFLNDEKDTIQKDDFRDERKELLRRLALLSSRGDQEATLLLNQIQHFCETVQNNKRFSLELEAFKTIDEPALAKPSKKQEAENIGEYAGAHIGTSIFATVGAGVVPSSVV